MIFTTTNAAGLNQDYSNVQFETEKIRIMEKDYEIPHIIYEQEIYLFI